MTATQRVVVGPVPSTRTIPALRQVWQFRELLLRLVVRNLKVKYQRSVLGFVWTLFNPLLMVAMLVGVFGYVIRIQMPHYWAFVISGYFVWNFVALTIGTGGGSLAEHAHMSRSVSFPSEVLIVSAAASRLLEFMAEIVMVVVALVLFHHHAVPSSFVLLPLLWVLQFLLVVGLAMPVATLSVFFSDVQHALPIGLTLLFYASPVFYPTHYVPEGIRQIYYLNPVAGLLELYRVILYEGRVPSLASISGVALSAVAIACIGYYILRRYRAVFAEIV